MSTIDERAATWFAPISESAPTGQDLRGTDTFIGITDELGKLGRVAAGEVDWPTIVSRCDELLRTTSKDTQIVAALCIGLLRTSRYAGLAAGLKAFVDIVRGYWDVLYPARPKTKEKDFKWLHMYLPIQMSLHPPQPKEYDDTVLCKKYMLELESEFATRMGGVPSVKSMAETLDRYLTDIAPARPAGGEAGQGDKTPVDPSITGSLGKEAGGTVAVGSALFLDSIQNDTQAQEVVKQAKKALRMASEYYQKRAEQLAEEKKKLEDQLDHANKVISTQRNVAEALGEGE